MRKDRLYNVKAKAHMRTSLSLEHSLKMGFPLAVYARNKGEAIEKARIIVNDYYNCNDGYMGKQYTYIAELEGYLK